MCRDAHIQDTVMALRGTNGGAAARRIRAQITGPLGELLFRGACKFVSHVTQKFPLAHGPAAIGVCSRQGMDQPRKAAVATSIVQRVATPPAENPAAIPMRASFCIGKAE